MTAKHTCAGCKKVITPNVDAVWMNDYPYHPSCVEDEGDRYSRWQRMADSEENTDA